MVLSQKVFYRIWLVSGVVGTLLLGRSALARFGPQPLPSVNGHVIEVPVPSAKSVQSDEDRADQDWAEFKRNARWGVSKKYSENQLNWITLLNNFANIHKGTSAAGRASIAMANTLTEMRKPDSALLVYEDILGKYPSDKIRALAQAGKGDALLAQRKASDAVALLEPLAAKYGVATEEGALLSIELAKAYGRHSQQIAAHRLLESILAHPDLSKKVLASAVKMDIRIDTDDWLSQKTTDTDGKLVDLKDSEKRALLKKCREQYKDLMTRLNRPTAPAGQHW